MHGGGTNGLAARGVSPMASAASFDPSQASFDPERSRASSEVADQASDLI